MKRIAAMMIASLFVLTAFAVLEMPTAMASTPTQDFSFPYSYGQPQVPSDVGAQGIQGPTAPLSTLGSPSSVLTLNQSAPSWWTTLPANVTFTVNVYNGTLASHTVGVGISVSLENTTTGNVATELTSASGVASFAVPPGWYVITAGTKSTSYENFTQTIFISGGSKTIYMIPSSYGTVAVNNGGTGVIWASYYSFMNLANENPYPYPQMNLSLFNNTSPNSGKLLGWGSTLSNGSIEFTGINDAYTYYIGLDGFSDQLSGTTYGMVNSSSGGFTPTSQVYHYTDGDSIRYYTTSTATVVGTPIPVTNSLSSGSNNWVIAQNTTATGGNVVIGSKVYFGAPGLTLTFKNTNVLFKFYAGFEGYTGSIILDNSTIHDISATGGATPILFSSSVNNLTMSNSTMYDVFSYLHGKIVMSNASFYNDVFNDGTDKNVSFSYSYLLSTSVSSSNIAGSYIYNSIVSITNANHDTLSDMPNGATATNLSYSIITGYKEIPSGDSISYTLHFSYMYNDWIDLNYSLEQLASLKLPLLQISGIGSNNMYVNYSLVYMDALFYFDVDGNGSFNHDMFTNFVLVSDTGATTAQMFLGSLKVSISYTNDTFGTVYYNQSLMKAISPHYYIGIGQFIEDMNQKYPTFPLGHLNITHNTFEPVLVGDGAFAPQSAPADIVLGEGNVQSNVSGNLFMNNYKYDTGPNATTITPYTWNIVDWAGYNYIYNNVFENLNNQIIPIGSNNNESGTQGYGTITGGHSTNHLGGNKFYYSPSTIESYVPLGSMTSEENSAGIGQIAYQMPTFYNDSMNLNNPQYVFNTSKMINDPLFNLKTWIYNITPDVNILSGTPTLSYSNGLVGAPQPNFTWDGYKYTESVEPTYIQVGVNSANAPPVNLQFNGAPDTAYSIAMYDHGQLIDYTNITSSSNGVVTFTYNPATMPLDPVFELTTISASIPPSTPVSNTFLYLEIGLIALLSVGLVIPLIIRRQHR